jgi:hypothetical protein
MSYTATHGRALRTVTKKGTAVTFTLTTPGTYDETTDTWSTPVTDTCAGYAVEMEGDPKEYADLITQNPATLFFTPSTFGDLPALDSVGTWAGASRTVKRIFPLRPDGTVIAARVIVV